MSSDEQRNAYARNTRNNYPPQNTDTNIRTNDNSIEPRTVAPDENAQTFPTLQSDTPLSPSRIATTEELRHILESDEPYSSEPQASTSTSNNGPTQGTVHTNTVQPDTSFPSLQASNELSTFQNLLSNSGMQQPVRQSLQVDANLSSAYQSVYPIQPSQQNQQHQAAPIQMQNQIQLATNMVSLPMTRYTLNGIGRGLAKYLDTFTALREEASTSKKQQVMPESRIIITEIDPTEEENIIMSAQSKKIKKNKSSSTKTTERNRDNNQSTQRGIARSEDNLKRNRKALPTYRPIATYHRDETERKTKSKRSDKWGNKNHPSKKYSIRNEHLPLSDTTSDDDIDAAKSERRSNKRTNSELLSEDYVEPRRSKKKKASRVSFEHNDEFDDNENIHRFNVGGEHIEVTPNQRRLYMKHWDVEYLNPETVKRNLTNSTTCYKNARRIKCDRIPVTNNYINIRKGPSIPDLCSMRVSPSVLSQCTQEEVRAFIIGLINYISAISMRTCKNVFAIGKQLLYMYKVSVGLKNKASDTKPIDCIEPKSLRESLKRITNYWKNLPRNSITLPILHKRLNELLSHGCSKNLHYVFNGTTTKNNIIVASKKKDKTNSTATTSKNSKVESKKKEKGKRSGATKAKNSIVVQWKKNVTKSKKK